MTNKFVLLAAAVALAGTASAPPCNWLGGPGNPFHGIGGCVPGNTFGCFLIGSGPVLRACHTNGERCCLCVYQDNTYWCFGFVFKVREVERVSKMNSLCAGARCEPILE